MKCFLVLLYFWACAITFLSSLVQSVKHGTFSSVIIKSGLNSLVVENIPKGNRFIIYQLHSPFNPILASTQPSFFYEASQFAAHIGLASLIDSDTKSTYLYVYSPYESNVTTWFKADAYTADYPIPGGCQMSKLGDTAIASVTSVVPNVLSSLNASALLNYWTSSINFVAAAKYSAKKPLECLLPLQAVEDRNQIIYHLYASSLISSGASYNTYQNPTPKEAAKVIKRMTFSDESFSGKHVYSSLGRSPTIDQNFFLHLSIARRPCTAVIVTVVAEYLGSFKVPYVPVIVFGCPNPPASGSSRDAATFKENASAFLNCAVLPQDNPTIYLPIAVLLLASLCYSASLNYWIWPRCAVSVMLIASVLGMIFFYRYSEDISDTPTALVVSAILPALVALSVFLIIWCRCIRPTLQYQRIFGRGPLMKMANPTESRYREPWNDELHPNTVYQSPDMTSGETVTQNPTSVTALGTLPPVTEEEPRVTAEYDRFSVGSGTSLTRITYESTKPPGYVHLFGIRIFKRPKWLSSSPQNIGRSTALFSLRPRRVARLPPILPATFVIVAFLSISFDRSFSLNQSPTPFLLFTIVMSCLILGFLCIFKNFAFGLSTATVGLYIALSCICLFLLPGAFLPHIVIEYFLMVTWVEKRLPVLRIAFYGLYDIILLVLWFLASIILGMITLCLIRLQDARELAEAQHWYAIQFGSHTEQPIQANSMSLLLPVHTERSGFFSFIPRIVQVPFLRTASSTSVMANTPNMSLGQTSYEAAEYQISGNADNFVATSTRSATEKQPLLHGRLTSTYGGLASTNRPPLMPLSRVQLAAAGGLSNCLAVQPPPPSSMSSLPVERVPTPRNPTPSSSSIQIMNPPENS